MGFVRRLTGKDQARAVEKGTDLQIAFAREAIEEQRAAGERGQEFLAPFGELGQQGIEQAGFLTDPQAQFDFLQQNPLFQLALENANRSTLQGAAAGGRLSAGDTLTDLSKNVLLASQPLIGAQRQGIRDLLNIGTGIATTQANVELGVGSNVSGLLTDIGSAASAGQIGEANVKASGAQNILNLALSLAGAA